MLEVEGQESVVETSENQESQSSAVDSSQESSDQSAKAAAPKPQDETPFHEHPRFKELVEQKNAAIQSTRALELKLAQLEGRLQSQPTSQAQAEKDELIEDLKKIDPRLAARLEAFGSSSKTIEQLQKKLDELENGTKQREEQTLAQNAISRVNTLHETNKVAPAIRAAIDAQLNSMYYQGKLDIRNQQAIEKAYNDAMEPFKAYAEELKREATKGYVQAKKADASIPSSQPKGTPAKAKAAPAQQFKSKEEMKQAMVKEFVAKQAAKRDASPV
jgi:hypothetical protein